MMLRRLPPGPTDNSKCRTIMPKTVYIGMTADILRHGHISVIETGRRYGEVVIGLLTDQAASRLKQKPCLEYRHRKRILENISGVKLVIPQEDLDYGPNLRKIRPDYMIHGEDWISGPQRRYRDQASAAMAEWGGEIIEVPGAEDEDPDLPEGQPRAPGTTPTIRLRQLRRQLAACGFVRVLEVHSPLCGLIAEAAAAEHDRRCARFDAMWSSSLVDSTVRGKPDIEALDHSTRFAALNDLFEVTTKPLLYDADTGGRVEHFAFTVRSLERMGVSAVVIEDKTGLKRNSLHGTDVSQQQESIENFCRKIRAGKTAQVTNEFAVIGRIESLILDAGLDDALVRAREYVAAGADGIVIHSRSRDPGEVFAFCDRFRKADAGTMLVAIPTSYTGVYEHELEARGVNVVIYANHLLRASYPAMMAAARTILANGRCLEVDKLCMSVDDILRLIPLAAPP
jgi:phosphoenolpyruvate phosphomutase / 2-hydroxyethylphosphonate cytidylyltransferase